jgi:hypothetical protein
MRDVFGVMNADPAHADDAEADRVLSDGLSHANLPKNVAS